jgi:hypothetical protein
LLAAVCSWFRGGRYVHSDLQVAEHRVVSTEEIEEERATVRQA